MLKELVMILESLPEGEGQLARASYKMSMVSGEMGRQADSEEYRKKAFDLKAKLGLGDETAISTEESFTRLCPWMLW